MQSARQLGHHPRQLLYRVQQRVPVLHDRRVHGVLAVRSVGLDNAIDLVDRAVESAGGDEARELAADLVSEV